LATVELSISPTIPALVEAPIGLFRFPEVKDSKD
jgi:hypothetical protein